MKAYIVIMTFGWDPKKNEKLKAEGRPSFEDAVKAIERGVFLDGENTVHPGQRILVIEIADYPHAVPYEIRGDVLWLITIYPARKYKR